MTVATTNTNPKRMGVAVFLDRDGVLNRAVVCNGKPYPPKNLDELEILPGVPEALEALQKAGYRLIVVTNQPDIGRGTTSQEAVDKINDYLRQLLILDAIEICPHDDADCCDCRKPLPGLLLRGAARFGIDLSRSFMIGDRWRDIEAGRSAGCRTILVGDGYTEGLRSPPDAQVASLFEASALILNS